MDGRNDCVGVPVTAPAQQYAATQLQTPINFAELPFSKRARSTVAEPSPQLSNYRTRSMLGEDPNVLLKKSGRNSLAQLTDPSHGLIFYGSEVWAKLPT